MTRASYANLLPISCPQSSQNCQLPACLSFQRWIGMWNFWDNSWWAVALEEQFLPPFCLHFLQETWVRREVCFLGICFNWLQNSQEHECIKLFCAFLPLVFLSSAGGRHFSPLAGFHEWPCTALYGVKDRTTTRELKWLCKHLLPKSSDLAALISHPEEFSFALMVKLPTALKQNALSFNKQLIVWKWPREAFQGIEVAWKLNSVKFLSKGQDFFPSRQLATQFRAVSSRETWAMYSAQNKLQCRVAMFTVGNRKGQKSNTILGTSIQK